MTTGNRPVAAAESVINLELSERERDIIKSLDIKD